MISDFKENVNTSSYEQQLEVNITCSCGHFHQYLPADNKLVDGIYWFQCEGGCNSTRTFIPELVMKRLDKKIAEDRKMRIRDEVKRQNEWVKRSYGIVTKPKPDEV